MHVVIFFLYLKRFNSKSKAKREKGIKIYKNHGNMQDIAAHVMDIAQNSVRAKASRIEIEYREDPGKDSLTITIQDNGCGMNEATLARVTDPFFTSRTVRKVGLGIPLLKQNAERTGGSFSITSREGEGTTVRAEFVLSNWDTPPRGDMGGTVVLLATANPEIEFIYWHITAKGEYVFDTREVKETLGDVPINHLEIVSALQELVRENIRELSTE